MDRRSFLTKAAVGGTTAAAASTLAAPLYAQGNRTLTLVTTWSRGLAGVHDAAQRGADTITAMTDGQLTVDLKAAGELVGAFEVFDAVTSGQADMYHGADYYFVGQHPGYAFFTAVPMGMTAQELANWYYQDGGIELHDELGQIFGLKSFLGGNTGAQGGGWFRKEITSAADFNGLKFRMPGLGGKALGKLGASVQNLPGGEIYQALSSGALDGTEWIGAWADEKMGFQEITKFYYTAGFHEPGAGLTLAMNREVYDSLTPSQQKIYEIAAGEAHQWSLTQFLANNGAALARLQSAGVKVLSFPDDVWDAFGKATEEVHAENIGDELYKKIHDSVMASMKKSSAWLKITDSVYTSQRDRVLGG
ncbi:MAG: TRAP transporter substrate-binding protein [Rhodobacteraceae bacterium]|nr:TRAP transporter substrate-binding protein [Paracoccaceae bacterium]